MVEQELLLDIVFIPSVYRCLGFGFPFSEEAEEDTLKVLFTSWSGASVRGRQVASWGLGPRGGGSSGWKWGGLAPRAPAAERRKTGLQPAPASQGFSDASLGRMCWESRDKRLEITWFSPVGAVGEQKAEGEDHPQCRPQRSPHLSFPFITLSSVTGVWLPWATECVRVHLCALKAVRISVRPPKVPCALGHLPSCPPRGALPLSLLGPRA